MEESSVKGKKGAVTREYCQGEERCRYRSAPGYRYVSLNRPALNGPSLDFGLSMSVKLAEYEVDVTHLDNVHGLADDKTGNAADKPRSKVIHALR